MEPPQRKSFSQKYPVSQCCLRQRTQKMKLVWVKGLKFSFPPSFKIQFVHTFLILEQLILQGAHFVLWTQKRAPNRTSSRLGRFAEQKRTTNQFSAVSSSSFRYPIWEQTEGEFRKAVCAGIEADNDQVCLPPKLEQHSLGLHRRNNHQNQ